jgi:Ser/Thr protein kinase RdoA (MazF antagonist)
LNYPLLSRRQQQSCPTLKQAAQPLPVLFEDSTHQLWHCDTVDGSMVLKVCNQKNIQQSFFWRGMNTLFKADFPDNLQHMAITCLQIAAISPLLIPETITAQANSFVLVNCLAGDTVEADNVTDTMVCQLAEHLGQLHQQTQTVWGPFHHPALTAEQWPIRLHDTIKALAENHSSPIPADILNTALLQVKDIKTDAFVPIMPDLRWDQFLQQNEQLSALVDLDAFVVGPKELELVLLEYLLSEQQAEIFNKHYQQYVDTPDLAMLRMPYRVLLFLMDVLGEQDLENWLARDVYW